MVRLSDLVRGRPPAPPDPPAPPGPPAPAAAPPPPPRGLRSPDPPPADTEPPAAPPSGPTGEAEAGPRGPRGDSADVIFDELQRFLEKMGELVVSADAFPWAELIDRVERVVESLAESSELFWIASKPVPSPGVAYLAQHQARVAVLAAQIGAGLGEEPERLVELGIAGCLIDLGLWSVPPTVLGLEPRALAEHPQYRAHPRAAAELIQRWGPPPATVVEASLVEAVLQHHEREQGQGFPGGRPGSAIHPGAKILGLVDTYAGLTLPPPPRAGLRPHEAVRDIIRSRNELFPASVIKALLGEVSVFPLDTQVRLNTGEVGTVIAVNRDHPLRPRVEIVDGKGGRPAARIVDLAELPFLYVTGPVSEPR
jgi:hypothetical protein